MRIATYYADCKLPDQPRQKQEGFDWRWAIGQLTRTAALQNVQTSVVTDSVTDMPGAWLRVGNAMQSGLMLWLLDAQHATIKAADGPMAMVSPDTLISKRIGCLSGDWDLCLLTRKKPKPIINSVIGFNPSERLSTLWGNICNSARSLSKESKEWGADIDALVQYLDIKPAENRTRTVDGVKVRLMPIDGVFQTVPANSSAKLDAVFWDFKGNRKRMMREYAGRL